MFNAPVYGIGLLNVILSAGITGRVTLGLNNTKQDAEPPPCHIAGTLLAIHIANNTLSIVVNTRRFTW